MTNSVKDEQNVESASATTLKELKDTLWKAADKLRGSMDASQYKDIVLGLVFLKYVTDAFDACRHTVNLSLTSKNEKYRNQNVCTASIK